MSVAGDATVNQRHCIALVDALISNGVRHAVLSPGSRNTPIVLALTALSAAGRPIELHGVLDERTAAFFALGLSRITDTPTLLSCTSGSAGAHYLPAFVEAAQSNVPLIAITADRPPELHARAAPQTVPQTKLFGPHVRWAFDLGVPADAAGLSWLRGVAAQAVDAATGPKPGPVHINAPFRKPLWHPDKAVPVPEAARHIAQVRRGPATIAAPDLERLASGLANTRRGCIVVGPDPAGRICPETIATLATRLDWPIIASPVSACRWAKTVREPIWTADALLRDTATARSLKAERVLCFGHTASSKAINLWISQADDVLCVNAAGTWRDPNHVVSTVIAADPNQLATALLGALPKNTNPQNTTNDWCAQWRALHDQAADRIDAACGVGWWSGAVIRQVIRTLPSGTLLHVGSSMPIRDLDSFGGSGAPIRVTANRGANGIDGTIATTFGEATAWSSGPVLGLMGDLTFLHDQASLMLARKLKRTVVLVVIDNGGGGIFSYLPIAQKTEVFEPWFRTPHDADILALCQANQVHCAQPTSLESLKDALAKALRSKRVSVLHLRVDGTKDMAAHKAVWDALRQPA
jgi:2-succinyl-5-enolpyruvyl-6-hydroxy-3-cyclohexene-1-carboxylate synthase